MILKGPYGYRVRWRERGILRQQTCRTKEEATFLNASKMLNRRQAAPPVNQRNILLNDFAPRWLEQLSVATKTRSSYAENFGIYIKPTLGNLKIRDIHRLHIKQLLATAKNATVTL